MSPIIIIVAAAITLEDQYGNLLYILKTVLSNDINILWMNFNLLWGIKNYEVLIDVWLIFRITILETLLFVNRQ